MRRKPIIAVLSCAALATGGYLLISRRAGMQTPRRQRRSMMDRMMKALPEGSPPKVISSVLSRLQEQNEEILALIREQNELLRSTTRIE